MNGQQEPNYLAHAFKSQYNLIGLGTALGFAVLSGTILPLVLAAGVELVVLPLVSGNGRFQRVIRARLRDEEETAQTQKRQSEASHMLQYMPDAERKRYAALNAMSGEIRANYSGMDSSSQMLLEQLVDKLDFLLSFYLRMRFSLSRYTAYFNSTDPDHIQERIAMLDHEIQNGPERVREVKRRTKAVLEKRLERYSKAAENRQLVEAQTETVMEVLQLLRDQSYSMRDPRSITDQIDGLVSSAEETERGVKDLEDLLAIEQEPLLSGGGAMEIEPEIEAELERGRQGARASQQAVPTAVKPWPPAKTAAVPPPPPPPPARRKARN